MSDRVASAVVIGAGVVGVATAYALARRGVAVTLIDAADEAGTGTSFANGGQLSYVYSDALASPAMLRKLPWLALGRDPAFRIRPSIDPGFIAWGLRFIRQCTGAGFARSTLAGLTLGLESRAAMQALLAKHPLAFGHDVPGKLHLYGDEAGFAAARTVVALKAPYGAIQHALTHKEALAVEPALAARPGGFVGAIHSPQEAVGDPWRFSNALAALLASDYGVTLRFGTRIARVEAGSAPAAVTMTGERIAADRIVLCTGVDTARLLKDTGIRVPIQPIKGYSFTAPPGPHAPSVSITDVGRKLVFCMLDGRMRIAGLADLGVRTPAVDPRRLAVLIGSARDALPQAAGYDAASAGWAGLRPATPDGLPVIGEARPGLVLNVGHGGLGWTYAMGSGERAARLIAGSGD